MLLAFFVVNAEYRTQSQIAMDNAFVQGSTSPLSRTVGSGITDLGDTTFSLLCSALGPLHGCRYRNFYDIRSSELWRQVEAHAWLPCLDLEAELGS